MYDWIDLSGAMNTRHDFKVTVWIVNEEMLFDRFFFTSTMI